MKKILITGASGFVGSHLVEEALRRNLEVYAGVRRSSSREYLKDERLHFIEIDFSGVERMTEQFSRERFDYIIHNAGVVTAPKLQDYWTVNCDYVKNFTKALIASGAVPEKFTFISSLAAYGPASGVDLSEFLKEDDERKPINTYGEAKLAAERYLMSLPDFPYVVVRPAGVYGPREREIFTFFKLIKNGLEGYIGFRKQHLAFVHVQDLARVVLDATVSDVSRRSYFLSDGKHYSQQDMGRISRLVLGKKTVRLYVPVALVRGVAWALEQFGKLSGSYPALNLEKVRILESMNWKCDIEPLRRDFNFHPKYDLESGLEDTLRWYQENKWL